MYLNMGIKDQRNTKKYIIDILLDKNLAQLLDIKIQQNMIRLKLTLHAPLRWNV